jgi:hypothetical protein
MAQSTKLSGVINDNWLIIIDGLVHHPTDDAIVGSLCRKRWGLKP